MNGINPQGKDLLQLLLRGASEANPVMSVLGAMKKLGPTETTPTQKLNPMQESILKKVIKKQGEFVDSAMEEGASGEQVLRDAGIRLAPNQPDPLSLRLGGTQPPELFTPAKGLFSSAKITPEGQIQRSGFLANLLGTSTQTLLDQAGPAQKILGREPLQAKDILTAITKQAGKAPTTWDIYKQAENEAKTALGGSGWMGMSPKRAIEYPGKTQEIFNALQEQFGQTPTQAPALKGINEYADEVVTKIKNHIRDLKKGVNPATKKKYTDKEVAEMLFEAGIDPRGFGLE